MYLDLDVVLYKNMQLNRATRQIDYAVKSKTRLELEMRLDRVTRSGIGIVNRFQND